MKKLLILALACGGCASQPMTPYQAAMVERGFDQAAAGFYRASDIYAGQQYVQPYQPLYSPYFNPKPIGR